MRPHAHDHTFFYGVNFEFSVNYHYWESRNITSEIRPIVGLHLHPFDIIFNPIVDTNYTGGFGGLEFVPATRIAYNFNDKYAMAFEEYSDDGTLRNFLPLNDQFHEVWADFRSLEQGPEHRNWRRLRHNRRRRQIDFQADALARPELRTGLPIKNLYRGYDSIAAHRSIISLQLLRRVTYNPKIGAI